MASLESATVFQIFKTSLVIACNRKEIPCKEKHIRRILSATFSDNSGVNFFVALDKIAKINDGIVRFKAYLILHLVLTEGSFYENLVHYAGQTLKRMKNIHFSNSLFSELCELYLQLLAIKVKFLQKMVFLKPNYSLIQPSAGIPFSDVAALAQFMQNLSIHLIDHYKFVNTILTNVQFQGVNPSIVPCNQCQLRAAIPAINDIKEIFKLMVMTGKKIDLASSTQGKPEFRSEFLLCIKTHFIPSFRRFKQLLTDISPISYIKERCSIPYLPDKFSFMVDESKGKICSTIQPKNHPKESIDTNFSQILVASKENSVSEESLLDQSNDDFFGLSADAVLIPTSKHPVTYPTFQQPKLEESDDDNDDEMRHQLRVNESMRQERALHDKEIAEINKANQELRKKFDAEKLKSDERDQYKKKFETIANLYSGLRQKYKEMCETGQTKTSDPNIDLRMTNQRLTEEVATLNNQLFCKEKCLVKLTEQNEEIKNDLSQLKLETKVNVGSSIFQMLLHELHNVYAAFLDDHSHNEPLSKSSFIKMMENSNEQIKYLSFKMLDQPDTSCSISMFLINSLHHVTQIIAYGKQYLQKAYDTGFDDQLKTFGSSFNSILENFETNNDNFDSDLEISKLFVSLDILLSVTNDLPEITEHLVENVDEFDFQKEANLTLHVVESSNIKLTDLKKSISHEPNNAVENIMLDNCNCLFEIIKKIIQDSVLLEKEIFDCNKLKDQGKKEFYKKNSAWSNGIIGFAKSMAPAVSTVTESLDGFVQGQTSIEEVTVSLNNMVALVTQFVMACKTKADPQSKPLASIRCGAREIYNMAHANVDKVKALQTPIIEPPIDISSLTKTRRVAFENDLQIRILELERDLERERGKLFKLRSATYH